MRKLLAGLLLVGTCVVLFPPKSRAVPLDLTYQIAVDTINVNSVTLSTTNFSSPNTAVNANVATAQWCINHLIVSVPNIAPANVTIAWSTNTLTTATTDYYVVTSSVAAPYDEQWGYHTPYCAPVGQPVVKINSSVAGSTVTVEGYLLKGGSGF